MEIAGILRREKGDHLPNGDARTHLPVGVEGCGFEAFARSGVAAEDAYEVEWSE